VDRAAPGPSRAGGAFAVAPPDEADRAPAAGGLDPLALERLLDERRRRDAALEEWKRTEF
jgi:hypothetical protein